MNFDLNSMILGGFIIAMLFRARAAYDGYLQDKAMQRMRADGTGVASISEPTEQERADYRQRQLDDGYTECQDCLQMKPPVCGTCEEWLPTPPGIGRRPPRRR